MNTLLRSIPKMDKLLANPLFVNEDTDEITTALRSALDNLRQDIQNGKVLEIPSEDYICANAICTAQQNTQCSLRRLINATGVVLHTNLGRAPLSKRAIDAVNAVAQSYSTLEYNLESGERGSRYSHVEKLLCALTGAESAIVVNNNASAVLLALSALAAGGEVVISRGELVEIGGAFRVPDVMKQSNAILCEVGTTNKTHLWDYENAICDNTLALLKVHTSNYRIIGFTESVLEKDLVTLGQNHSIPVIHDLGSGLLINPQLLGIIDEPYVIDSIIAGVDVTTFSGDKLLGGPQAGIIIGKKMYIDKIKKHPLTRAMRIDKLTLAALEGTLQCYSTTEKAMREIPVLNMLSAKKSDIQGKAQKLSELLELNGIITSVIEDFAQVGGGSVPQQKLLSFAVAINSDIISPEILENRARLSKVGVIGRISKDRFLLNATTIFEEDIETIAEVIVKAIKEE